MTANRIPEIVHETLLAEAWQNAHVAAVVFDEGRTFLTANHALMWLSDDHDEELRFA